jgi:hypothetical protein
LQQLAYDSLKIKQFDKTKKNKYLKKKLKNINSMINLDELDKKKDYTRARSIYIIR